MGHELSGDQTHGGSEEVIRHDTFHPKTDFLDVSVGFGMFSWDSLFSRGSRVPMPKHSRELTACDLLRP